VSDRIWGYCGTMAGGDDLVLNISYGDLLYTILLLGHCGWLGMSAWRIC